MKSKEFWDWYESYAAPRLKGETPFHNRANTFRAMMQYLDNFNNPVIVETGCIEGVENRHWAGNGCSTIIFDKYAQHNGGKVYSVEIDREKVTQARKLVSKCTKIMCDDSVRFLYGFKVAPDLLYLDASNYLWHHGLPYEIHHYNEFMAMLPKLKLSSLVVIDDTLASVDISDFVKTEIIGKGGLIARHAAEVGAQMMFTDYQTGWIGFPGLPDDSDYNTDQILQKAREFVEKGKWTQAYPHYKQILSRTPEPWNGVQRIMHGEACAFFA